VFYPLEMSSVPLPAEVRPGALLPKGYGGKSLTGFEELQKAYVITAALCDRGVCSVGSTAGSH